VVSAAAAAAIGVDGCDQGESCLSGVGAAAHGARSTCSRRSTQHNSTMPPGGIDLQLDLLQQQQQQQERSKRKSERRLRGADVSPGASQDVGGLLSQHSQADESSVQASIRRVERAALLEKIKLLQQHQQGRSLS
jgi:hypothetical protein